MKNSYRECLGLDAKRNFLKVVMRTIFLRSTILNFSVFICLVTSTVGAQELETYQLPFNRFIKFLNTPNDLYDEEINDLMARLTPMISEIKYFGIKPGIQSSIREKSEF